LSVQIWRKNDNLDRFQRFCRQNRNKPISVELMDDLGSVNGVLYDYRLRPSGAAGIFVLLTPVVIHPAFYSLDDLESLRS
jgi:hypothetical protein